MNVADQPALGLQERVRDIEVQRVTGPDAEMEDNTSKASSIVYEITYTIPNCTLVRGFSISPTSLQIVANSTSSTAQPTSSLVFEYDAREPLIASFYFAARETKNPFHEVTLKLESICEVFKTGMHFELPAGKGVTFPPGWISAEEAAWEKVFAARTVNSKAEGLGFDREKHWTLGYYDLVIRLQEKSARLKKEHSLLYVYCSVTAGKLGTSSKQVTPRPDLTARATTRTTENMSISVVEQKIELNGMAFKLGQVYNLAGGEDENPCLICLNEPANLVLQPCGHLALGDMCIKTYFEKNDNRICPLCRCSVKELISVKDSGIDYEKATEARMELEKQDMSQMGGKKSAVLDFRTGRGRKPLGLDSVADSFALNGLSRDGGQDSPQFQTLTHNQFQYLNQASQDQPAELQVPGKNYNPVPVRPAEVPQLDLDLASHQEIDLDFGDIEKEDPDGLHKYPSGRQFGAAMPKITGRDIQLMLQRSKERLPSVQRDFRMTYDEGDTRRSKEKINRLAETQKAGAGPIYGSYDDSKREKY